MNGLYEKPISVRFEHLLQTLSSRSFIEMQGLNNEIPFFIFPYKPQEHNEIMAMCQQLARRLGVEGIAVLNINLYDLTIELLKAQGEWDSFIDNETALSKTELLEDLQSSLNPQKHLVPAIANQMAKETFDILFLTGIGEIFPIIRSHNILENLQSTAKTFPTLMWFPGKYLFTPEGGSSLKLFDIPSQDDKYYRAFNILEYQLG